MKADEALIQSKGHTIYAVHHGDLLTLTRSTSGNYLLTFTDLFDPSRHGRYINADLTHVLNRDRRRLAEWYLTEQEARMGKRIEEFYIFTISLFQHRETKDVISVKFCNGDPMNGRHHADGSPLDMRDFLLNSNHYQHLSSWWVGMDKQSQRDKGRSTKL